MDSNSLKKINTWAKNRVVVDDQEMIAEFLHEVNKFYKHYMFYSAEAMADRKMVISVTHGAYDQPSLLILEVQGSPPKFEMIVETSYGSHVGIRSINGKKLRKSSITNLPWIESVLERFISKVDKKYRPQNIFTTEKMVDVVKREREEEHRK